MAVQMTETGVPARPVSHNENPAPPRTFAPGWEPAVLTGRGAAACRLSDFQDAFAALDTADRAWFCVWLTELCIQASHAELASR